MGRLILLDLPILAQPGVYLPVDPSRPLPLANDRVLSDPILVFEPYRIYAAAAIRAGRIPLWSSLNYCGSPFLAANQSAIFSPFHLIDYIWPGPAAIAWGQIAKTLVAGLGAFFYFRRAVGVGPRAAVVGGWCYPLGGFLVLWSGHPMSAVASWLPWLMWAADRAARRRSGRAVAGLALVTAAVLVSGHAATAAHVLIAGALQGAFSVADAAREQSPARPRPGVIALAAGFGLGVLLSAPQTLPTLEYMHTSRRIQNRAAGQVDTPPVGWSALPQVLLPYFEGATSRGAVYLGPGNRQESAASAYAGLLLCLVAAPFAPQGGRRRWLLLALGLVVLGLAQVLGLPVLSSVLDAWPMRALRNNRLTLLAGLGLLTFGVVGLDALGSSLKPSGRVIALASVLPAGLGLLSWYRTLVPPLALRPALAAMNPAAALPVREWFAGAGYWNVALCIVALGLLLILRKNAGRPALVWTLGVLSLAEVVLTSARVFPMSDPSLYYPRLPVLSELARAPAGRICGVLCLPPNLNQTHGLADVRGFDAADPDRMVELLERVALPGGPTSPDYARTMFLVPAVPSPITDMLGLRYFVYRGSPPQGVLPFLTGLDYFVLENPNALPRAWVPRRVEIASEPADRLRRLLDPAFEPREVAYAESGPPLVGPVRGKVLSVRDEPERVELAVEMQTEGMVVLSDSWNSGWNAYVGGELRPVRRVNHALRGVVVPAGSWRVEFRYEPASFRLGALLFLLALVGVVTLVSRPTS